MSLTAFLLAASALPVLELELRWVEQTVQASRPGERVLGTQSSPHIRPLGPVLRVQSGATAQWRLTLDGQAIWLQQAQGSARVLLPGGEGGQSWHLEATPEWRGTRQPIQLQLHWQQPMGETAGSAQSWRTTLPMPAGQWVTVSKQPSASTQAELPTGTLSTRPLALVRELQVRVRALPE